MRDLIDRIAATPGCHVFEPSGQPHLEPGHRLPDDLREFHRRCGGADLFVDADFTAHISAPTELVLANPVIVGQRVTDDISDSWYIVGRGGGSEFLSIDLHPDRRGVCYDSFFEVHGVPGSCAIVARSFTDLLERLLDAQGGHWYWLEPDFEGLGDAYDVVR